MQKRTYKNNRHSRKAFTLIELLIVIAIIGILFIVLISKVDFATDKAKATGVQTDFRSFQLAFETVAREHQGFSSLVDEDYEQLEMAINKNLDNKLKIDIDDMGNITMANGAQDPWGVEYHGQYVAGNDDKDRGVIVIYSNGADMTFGSNISLTGGIASVNTINDTGKDDYSIFVVYSTVNGYGEINSTTAGFSNNLNNTQLENNDNQNIVTPEAPENIVAPGLYETGSNYTVMVKDWDTLLAEEILYLNDGVLTSNAVLETYYWYNLSSDLLVGDLVISETVTNIGEYAFFYCENLTSVIMPDSIIEVGYMSFYCCSITNIRLSNNLKYIRESAFDSLLCTNINLPNGLEIIEDYAFYWSCLEQVNIPDSVIKLGSYAFYENYYLKEVVIGKGITEIEQATFEYCDSLEKITLHDNVVCIHEYAFGGTNFKTIGPWGSKSDFEIPPMITEIENGVFWQGFSVETIVIPNYITSIGDNAFSDSSMLQSVTILDGVSFIDKYAFQYCIALTDILIPNSVTVINEYAFQHCESLISVGFEGSNTDIELSNALTQLNDGLFKGCKNLKVVTLSKNIDTIGRDVFYQCYNIENVYYQGTLTDWCAINFAANFSNPCFNGSDLYISNELIVDITIPNSVIEINNYTFIGCQSLERITFHNALISIGDCAFYGTNVNNITIPSSVENYGEYIFANCYKLNNINLPLSMAEIPNYMFYSCTDLKTIQLPNSITSIGSYAFWGCESLEHILIPSSVTRISLYAFNYCNNLINITLPKNLTSLVYRVFLYCENLQTITILCDNVPDFGFDHFRGCNNLTTIYVPEQLVDEYKTHPNWISAADKIQAIT